MVLETRPTILVIGSDATLRYLLGRFVERSGYRKASAESISGCDLAALNPAAIVFLSTEQLAKDQAFLTEMPHLDAPILVCSSVIDEAKAIELGADNCLLHPLTCGDFQAALANATASKGVNPVS